MDPHLTIAIPTWNRPRELRKTLDLLLPQLSRHSDRCDLVLIDNCSDEPVSVTVADQLARFPGAAVTIRRNRFNIGGDPNILRCYEVSDAPWLWVLGDDDLPRSDALETIFDYVRRYPDCVYFNFSTGFYARPEDYFTRGTEEFVSKMDCFSNVLFISAGVVRQHAVRPYVPDAYHFVYSHASQVALLLRGLGSDGTCCFAKAWSVGFEQNKTVRPWTDAISLTMALDLPVLLELPIPYRVKRELYRKMFQWMHSVDWCFTPMLREVHNEEERQSASYTFDQMYSRGARFEETRRAHAGAWIKRLILKLPYPVLARVNRLRRGMEAGAIGPAGRTET